MRYSCTIMMNIPNRDIRISAAAWRGVFLISGLLLLAACSGRQDGAAGRPVDPDLAHPQLTYETIAPGVEHAEYARMQPTPLSYHVVRADLTQGGLSLGVLHTAADSGSERGTVGRMALALETPERYVVAAISGDYFGNGMAGTWGIQLVDGRLRYSPSGRSALMITPDGKPVIDRPTAKLQMQIGDDPAWIDLRDLNRPGLGKEAGLHLYARSSEVTEVPAPKGAVAIAADRPLAGGEITGTVTALLPAGSSVTLPPAGLLLACAGDDASLPAGLREGVAVRIRTEIVPAAREAVGGGPRIVRDGKVSIELVEDGIFQAETSYLKRHHPRAVVGLAAGGRTVLLVVVRGRCDESEGIRLGDLADLMVGLGATDAIMFDGGDSATIYEQGDYVVKGRAGARDMCNGLAILAPREPAADNGGGVP